MHIPAGTTYELCGPSQPHLRVFVLDEIHHNTEVRNANSLLAKQIISSNDIRLIGVEGFASRHDYYPLGDFHLEARRTARLPDAEQIASDRMFADNMLAIGQHVVGVDSEAWTQKIMLDNPQNEEVAAHSGQLERSLHFVRALLDEWVEGDCILNCGAAHSGHIMAVCRGDLTEPTWWPRAEFIRVRPVGHVLGPLGTVAGEPDHGTS